MLSLSYNYVSFLLLLKQRQPLAVLFQQMESQMQQRQLLDTIYKTANDRIERLTENLRRFLFNVIVPMLFVPAMIKSYVVYYFVEYEETPFHIPFPA